MKIKNWIEMLIGLSMSKANVNKADLSRIRRFAKMNGLPEWEVDLLIRQHLEWRDQQGYAAA